MQEFVIGGDIDARKTSPCPLYILRVHFFSDRWCGAVPTGEVVVASAIEGAPLLVASSTEALRKFKFRPYLLNGNATNVETQVGFAFVMDETNPPIKGHVEYMSSIPSRPEFRTGAVDADGAEVLSPRKISGNEPKLPPELAGKTGSVYLMITIGADGKVQDVRVIGGDEPLIAPVVDAVKQFVYEPQLVDGKPVVATIHASYHFRSR